ncbi:MAG: adenylate/guanylate cyclase domain-containing protein [Rhodospirillaceae bacterium]|nr:adenylate/guanylate cyclase domain-containing protein [Rhodospirillaceae bacterium]
MTDEQGELDRSLLLEVTHQGGIGSDGTCSMAPEDLALTPEDWLLTRGQDCSLTRHLLQSLCTVLLYHGLPLMRVTCFVRTLHPMTSGNSVIWRRDKPDPDEIRVLRGIEDTQAFRESPLPAIFEGAAAIRRPLFDDRCPMDFPILADLKAEGATDYVAMPLTFSDGEINFVTWVADGPNGFSVEQLSLLDRLMAALSLRLEVLARKRVTRELMRIYLGEDPGRRVLEGAIERGHGETIEAIVWYSDLRGFTTLSDREPPERVITLLNDYFEAVTIPIEERGGQILKFMGDGVLAIFPLADNARQAMTAAALKAAQEACILIDALNARRKKSGLPTVGHGISLHVGDVHYGNIGAPERLDFTAIGPAVNLASRIQTLCKRLDTQLLVSGDFASITEQSLQSLGWHPVRGLADPIEVFRLPEQTAI